MTLSELNNEFDIRYDSISSNAAAPLDDYEKSVFLTRAQEILVKTFYNPKFNVAKEGMDMTEKRRRDLAPLYKFAVSTSPITQSVVQTSRKSIQFNIASDVMFITQEKAKISSDDVCLNEKIIDVVPETYDRMNRNLKNPFKKPSEERIWRLDVGNLSGNKTVELYYGLGYSVIEYHYNYIKYPNPIILTTLTGGLTINNQTNAQNTELPNIVHSEIVDLAVELALEATGNPRFNTKTQHNQKTIN